MLCIVIYVRCNLSSLLGSYNNVGTHSLILALRKFILRNGTQKLFINDNFKSFKSKEKNYFRAVNVNWKFILEKSSCCGVRVRGGGGGYHRLIVVMKNVLQKAIGRAR